MVQVTPAEEAELFLNALMHAGSTRLDDVQVIVFEVSEKLDHTRRFISALEQIKTRAEYPAFVRALVTLETEGTLTLSDFYVLDDHLTVKGNQVVADALLETLARSRTTRSTQTVSYV